MLQLYHTFLPKETKMSIEQEIELKILINKQIFNQLQALFKTELTHISQTNHYYDTKNGLLHSHRQALRIRETEKSSVVTLKTKVDSLTSHEITVDYTADLVTTIKQNPDLNTALSCSAEELTKIAHFTTTRSFSALPFGTLFLDFTQYENNQFDYELEIELFNSEDITLAQQWLNKYAIPYNVAAPKIARAIAAQ